LQSLLAHRATVNSMRHSELKYGAVRALAAQCAIFGAGSVIDTRNGESG
jgi:hypothetical protein